MKMTFKELISICLSMVLAFSLALPVYAGSAISGSISSNYEFDEATGHLTIGKVIEKKSILEINSIPKDKIKSVTIRDGVTDIHKGTFEGCTGLKEVTLGNSVKRIGHYSISYEYVGVRRVKCSEYSVDIFEGCTSLSSINVNEENQNFKSIDGVLFSKDGKTLLKFPTGKRETNYTIPKSVTSIGNSAFSGCTGLKQIRIPNSVKSIGKFAFKGCTDLKEITIPNSVKSIGTWAFKGCTDLKEVTIPNSARIAHDAFDENTTVNRQ